MPEAWPFFAIAGLGAFHGLNPAMGWLFAVALGLHRRSRAVVFVSLLPIAAGHALSIITVAGLLVATGFFVPHRIVSVGSGLLLIGWATYHWRFGYRHRVRFGMQAGLFGLAIWSSLMATAHGAGLMLWPVLMPLCWASATKVGGAVGPFGSVLVGVGVHTLAMLATTALVAALVYEWLGVAILRSAWVNVDRIWSLALIATGALLLFV